MRANDSLETGPFVIIEQMKKWVVSAIMQRLFHVSDLQTMRCVQVPHKQWNSCHFRIWAAILSLQVAIGSSALAQSFNKSIDPRFFGLNIPAGKVVAGGDRRVTTRDEEGNAIVAKIHVEVGEYRVVMLPDGTLVIRKSNETELTDRAFQAASKDELAGRLSSNTFKNFKTDQTRRYLYVYNTSDDFALATSRILETMFKGVVQHAQAQRIEVTEPDVPLVVIMFRSEDEFQRYRRMAPGLIAYYHILSNEIVLYEESKLGNLNRDLALRQSISTIAHEGAHQILHNIGVQARLSAWPMWLAEGLAEYFAPTTFAARLKWKGAGQVNDLRMFELENYLLSNSSEGLNGGTIGATVQAARLSSTGYASAWALTHYLAKNQRLQFNEFVRKMSELGPLEGNLAIQGPGMIPQNLEAFQEQFGSDLADMERRLVLHLKKQPYQPPFSELPHYLATVSYLDGQRQSRAASMFISEATARRWINDTLAQLTQEQQRGAQQQIHECQNRLRAVQLKQQWLQSRN